MQKEDTTLRQPSSRNNLSIELETFCRSYYADNPVVQVKHIETGLFHVSVGQDRGRPRVFRIHVSESQAR